MGYTPAFFFDGDKVYMQGAAAPGTNLFEINLLTGEKISPERTIWPGSGGLYPEGPHIYKRNARYYLMISEGDTHGNHMATMACAKDTWGPYESCPKNSILTARGKPSTYIPLGTATPLKTAKGGGGVSFLGAKRQHR